MKTNDLHSDKERRGKKKKNQFHNQVLQNSNQFFINNSYIRSPKSLLCVTRISFFSHRKIQGSETYSTNQKFPFSNFLQQLTEIKPDRQERS